MTNITDTNNTVAAFMQGMAIYTLKSGYTFDAEAIHLIDAMRLADEWVSYSQADIIVSINDVELARRVWCGSLDGLDECDDPIQFGDFGYYTDWHLA